MSHAILCRGLHHAYADGTAALNGIDLDIGAGEAWGLIGANGSGKSTLLHYFAGLYPAESHLTVLGCDASAGHLAWIRSRVGFVFQNAEDQLFMPTLGEDVAFGPQQLGLEPAEIERRVGAAIARMRLSGLERRPPHRLSGGEKRAAALATVLSLEPEILILDEPTNDLDPLGRQEFAAFLKGWTKTLIAASHDLELILDICTRVAILNCGRVVATGEPRKLLSDAELMARHRLVVPLSLRMPR